MIFFSFHIYEIS